jgi:hypothetical protein
MRQHRKDDGVGIGNSLPQVADGQAEIGLQLLLGLLDVNNVTRWFVNGTNVYNIQGI